MQAVIQRVSGASVEVDNLVSGEIQTGIVILLAIHDTDSDFDSDFIIDKITKARIFEDATGKFSKTIREVNGKFLIIPQFTLYGDIIRKSKPSFMKAMKPELAEQIFIQFCAKMKVLGFPVETGKFRAYMKVKLINEGPVTFIVSSDHLKNNA